MPELLDRLVAWALQTFSNWQVVVLAWFARLQSHTHRITDGKDATGPATKACPLRARAWRTADSPYAHPEIVEGLVSLGDAGGEGVGLCFSGGGMRSASLSVGYLRALHAKGHMSRVKYITAVSGGSWATVPYTFLPASISDEQFLGRRIAPSQLTRESLTATDSVFVGAIGAMDVPLDPLTFASWVEDGDESYSNMIANWLLRPLDLWESGHERYFTLNATTRASILNRNSALKQDDVIVSREGRPFLVVCATLLTDSSRKPEAEIPIELTPLYAGMRVSTSGGRVGGGFVESFAYDHEYSRADGEPPAVLAYSEVQKARFTLADVMGASGSAPSQLMDAIASTPVGKRLVPRIFPAFMHFPLAPSGSAGGSRPQFHKNVEYVHADGGAQENLGIMPLLARRLPRIVVFENTMVPINVADVNAHTISHRTIDISISALFEAVPDSEYDAGVGAGGSNYRGNIVFSSGCIFTDAANGGLVRGEELKGAALYEALVRQLCKRKVAGKPVNALGEFVVHYKSEAATKFGLYPQRDPATGEERPYRVTIAWVYNELCGDWVNGLAPELKRQGNYFHRVAGGGFSHADFERFPLFKTFREDGGFSVCGLHTHQSAALAHHACYVAENCAVVGAVFS